MRTATAVFTLAALLACGAQAADPAGSVSQLTGSAQARDERGSVRDLSVGDALATGEVITTGRQSRVVLRFNDQSRFELGPGGEMEVESFSLGDSARREEPSFFTRIARGAFRFVSGLIAKRGSSAMRVRGNVATIGIRGTHVAGEFDESTATIILLEPEGEPHATAIDVSNEFGKVTIDEPGYGTDVPDRFSAPSPPRRMREATIRNVLDSVRRVQRINVPRPRR